MAARMSDRSTQRKEDYLEWLCAQFCVNSRAYVSAVKAALRSQARENAAEIFETAIDILSQDFPDPTSIDGQLKEEKDGDGNELNSLKDRMDQVEKQLLEVQNNHSFSESRMKKNIRRLDAEIGSLKNKAETQASETEGSIKELTVISKENSANIQGLRKLQNLLKQKNQAAVAPATPLSTSAISGPSTAASTSAMSGPFTAAITSAMSWQPTAANTSSMSRPSTAASTSPMSGPPTAASISAMSEPPIAASISPISGSPTAANISAISGPPTAASTSAFQWPALVTIPSAISRPPSAASTSVQVWRSKSKGSKHRRGRRRLRLFPPNSES